MQILKRYSRGSVLLGSSLLQLQNVSPLVHPQIRICLTDLSPTHHAPHLSTIASAPAQILLDSGAEGYNYISTAFCRRVGLDLHSGKDFVTVKGVKASSGVVTGVLLSSDVSEHTEDDGEFCSHLF